jgi:hypothetical protein
MTRESNVASNLWICVIVQKKYIQKVEEKGDENHAEEYRKNCKLFDAILDFAEYNVVYGCGGEW